MSPVFPSWDIWDEVIVGGPEPGVVVVIRPVVVPVARAEAGVRGIVPIAASDRAQNILSPRPLHSAKAAKPSADHRAQLIDENRGGSVST